jgi:hypothetical protein
MLLSPVRAVVAIAFVVIVGWFLQAWLGAGYFTVIAVLLVWGQVAGFFLPTWYTLSEEGVSVRGLVTRKEKPWRDFRSYCVDRGGVLLSPFPVPSRLARFRGVSLQFHANRDEVLGFVGERMRRQEDDDADVGDEGQAG